MPTARDRTIGASGADYTTIALWEDGEDEVDLTLLDEVRTGLLFNETFTGNVIIAGCTTDATRYRRLKCNTGASFRDNASVQTNALRYNASNGAACNLSDHNGFGFNIAESFVRLEDLQATMSGIHQALISQSNAYSPRFDHCIFERQATGNYIIHSAYGGWTILNSLLCSRENSTDAWAAFDGNLTVVNCTFATPENLANATNGIHGNYPGTRTLKNCMFFGCDNVITSTTGTTFTTCYTDDATPPTGCTTATYANQFENTTDATRDFRLKSGADAIDTGTTDSTNAPIDIAGTARPSGAAYDVGCWELVAAGGGTTRGMPFGAVSTAFAGGRTFTGNIR